MNDTILFRVIPIFLFYSQVTKEQNNYFIRIWGLHSD